MPRAGLTESLRALEVIRDGTAELYRQVGMPSSAVATKAITDNAIGIALELAAAVKAALDGDLAPARAAHDALALDRMEIQP